MKTQKIKNLSLVIYTVTFYALWALYELVFSDLVSALITNEDLRQLIRDGIIKNLIWTLPAALLIRRFQSDVTVSLREMFTTKVRWLKYLPIFLFFTVYLLAGAMLQHGRLAVSSHFGADDMIIVLFVGLSEETVFRGWLLNITVRENRKWRYILINAIMFLAIHFPIWIAQGAFISNFTSLGFIPVMALSVLFSWVFLRSRNLLVPIALHMYWDLLVFLFY